MIKSACFGLAVISLLACGNATAQLSEEAAAGAGAQNDILAEITPEGKRHFDAALGAAASDLPGPLQLCNQARPKDLKFPLPSSSELRGTMPTDSDLLRRKQTMAEYIAAGGLVQPAPEPTRLFDNLYYIGIENVSAWAVNTPDGIIIIDALNNGREWVERIEPGMRKLGLDPARIRHVLLTHGHGDHFGGADYLRRTYGARVWMSELDWELAPKMLDKPYFDAPPAKDMVISDGQKLTLGGETITMRLTPGHTRGTVSMFIPVTDHGRKHVALLWGGTGFNFPHTPDRFAQYAESAKAFLKLARAAGADVPLSPHPDFDGAVHKIRRLAARGKGASHPFVLGKKAVERYLTIPAECALAYGAQLRPR